MGAPLQTPPEIGWVCDNCNGVLWPTDETPRYVQIAVSNIQMCPGAPHPAPSGIWTLEQRHIDYPCEWEIFAEPYTLHYQVTPIAQMLNIKPWGEQDMWYFYGSLLGCATPTFVNQFVTCHPDINYGRFGSVVVTFP